MKKLFLLILLMLTVQACKKEDTGTSPEAPKYGTITGKLFESGSGIPIAWANIKTTPSTNSVTTDSLGSYKLENLAEGEYSVLAMKNGYDSTSIKLRVIAGSNATGDIFIQKTDSSRFLTTGTITGTVINLSTNLPVANVLINTVPSTSNVITNAQGLFTLTNVTPGLFTVYALKTGFDSASTKITVVKGHTSTANLLISPKDTASTGQTGSIQGTITDGMTGNGLAGVTVITEPSTSSVLTDITGKYIINDMPAAKYKLTASKTGYTATSASVTVNTGKVTLANFEMITPTGKIKGKVIDSETGEALGDVNIRTAPSTSTITTGLTGEYEIPQVTPGTLTLTAEKSGYINTTVSITVRAGIITTADIVMKRQ